MKNFIVNASRKVWQELIQNVNHYSYSLDSTVIVPMPKNNQFLTRGWLYDYINLSFLCSILRYNKRLFSGQPQKIL